MTTSIVETKFKVEGVILKIFDVGGQRSERKKWAPYFDDVSAIIFLSAISSYDQTCFEDNNTNRSKFIFALLLFPPFSCFVHTYIHTGFYFFTYFFNCVFLITEYVYLTNQQTHEINIGHLQYKLITTKNNSTQLHQKKNKNPNKQTNKKTQKQPSILYQWSNH